MSEASKKRKQIERNRCILFVDSYRRIRILITQVLKEIAVSPLRTAKTDISLYLISEKIKGESIMDERKNQEEKLKEIFDSLTDEQKEKIKACKTPDEVVKLVKSDGFELSDEALELISGGIVPRPGRYGTFVRYL